MQILNLTMIMYYFSIIKLSYTDTKANQANLVALSIFKPTKDTICIFFKKKAQY